MALITTIIISIFTSDFNVSTFQIFVLWIVTFFVLGSMYVLIDKDDDNTLIIIIFFLILTNPYEDTISQESIDGYGMINKDVNTSYKKSNMLIFSLHEKTRQTYYKSLPFNNTQTYVGILGGVIGTIDNYYPKGFFGQLSVREKFLKDLEYNFDNMTISMGNYIVHIIDDLWVNLKKLYLKAFGTKNLIGDKND